VNAFDPNAAFRADTLLAWIAAQGDLAAEAAALADAARYDATHPGEPSLLTELCAAVEGDVPEGVAV
jgi:hypothetical protein